MKQLLEVIDFGVALGNALGEAYEDKELSLGDLPLLWEPLSKIADAFEDIEKVVDELGSLTPEQIKEIEAHVVESFDIPQERCEEIAVKAVSVATSVLGLVNTLRRKESADS